MKIVFLYNYILHFDSLGYIYNLVSLINCILSGIHDYHWLFFYMEISVELLMSTEVFLIPAAELSGNSCFFLLISRSCHAFDFDL